MRLSALKILIEQRLLELINRLKRAFTDESWVFKDAVRLALLDKLSQVAPIVELRRILCILVRLVIKVKLQLLRCLLLRIGGKAVGATLHAPDLHLHLPDFLLQVPVADLVQVYLLALLRVVLLLVLQAVIGAVLLLQIVLATATSTFQVHVVPFRRL